MTSALRMDTPLQQMFTVKNVSKHYVKGVSNHTREENLLEIMKLSHYVINLEIMHQNDFTKEESRKAPT